MDKIKPTEFADVFCRRLTQNGTIPLNVKLCTEFRNLDEQGYTPIIITPDNLNVIIGELGRARRFAIVPIMLVNFGENHDILRPKSFITQHDNHHLFMQNPSVMLNPNAFGTMDFVDENGKTTVFDGTIRAMKRHLGESVVDNRLNVFMAYRGVALQTTKELKERKLSKQDINADKYSPLDLDSLDDFDLPDEESLDLDNLSDLDLPDEKC